MTTAQRDSAPEELSPGDRKFGRRLAVAGLVLAALAAVPSYLALRDSETSSTTTVPPRPPVLRVLSPTHNQTVSSVIVVRGTSENLRPGQTIWVLVAPRTTNLMFLQSGPAFVQSEGGWINANVHVGQENEKGEFDVVTVIADGSATKVFKDQRVPCEATGDCPGISELPSGAIEYGRVIVRR